MALDITYTAAQAQPSKVGGVLLGDISVNLDTRHALFRYRDYIGDNTTGPERTVDVALTAADLSQIVTVVGTRAIAQGLLPAATVGTPAGITPFGG